jgi:hypothetical protein
MSCVAGPNTTTNGLIWEIDAANTKSLSGLNMVNLAGSGITTLTSSGASAINGSITYNGAQGYGTVVGSVTSPVLSPRVATYNIWIKPTSAGMEDGNAGSLLSRGNYNTMGGWFIHLQAGTISENNPKITAPFAWSKTANYSHETFAPRSLNGWENWCMATICVDAKISCYIDGQFKDEAIRNAAASGEIIYGTGTINTGGDTDMIIAGGLSYAPLIWITNSWRPIKGDIGIIQMWNRRLTTSEIAELYNVQKIRYGL